MRVKNPMTLPTIMPISESLASESSRGKTWCECKASGAISEGGIVDVLDRRRENSKYKTLKILWKSANFLHKQNHVYKSQIPEPAILDIYSA